MKDIVAQQDSMGDSRIESEAVARLRQHNEQLENEKKALLRKLDSLSRENPQGLKE